MTNVNELFGAFAEAAKAVDELPQVRSEVVKLKVELDQTKTALELSEYAILERDDEIAKLRADLANREAELTSATFRADRSQEALDHIRGFLGVQSGAVGVDVAPVTASEASVTKSMPSTVTKAMPVTAGEAGSERIELDRTLGEAMALEKDTNFINAGTDNPLPQSPSVAESTAGDATPSTDPSPYSGRPHWQKPTTMTWGDWDSNGGQTPYWYEAETMCHQF